LAAGEARVTTVLQRVGIAAGAAALLGLAGCGGDSARKAVYAVAHDAEHNQTEKVCRRLITADRLPPEVSRAFGLASRPDVASADCRSRLAEDVAERLRFVEPYVEAVRPVAVPAVDGVSDAATATVAFDAGTRDATVRLVRLAGLWRVVVAPDYSGPA
jgi:hypothetical protein